MDRALFTLGSFDPEPMVIHVGNELPAIDAMRHDTSGGGVFEGQGFRQGHQISWQAFGARLELVETCARPGVTVAHGELAFQFSSTVLCDIGISQLMDGSLLLSVATSAPAGG